MDTAMQTEPIKHTARVDKKKAWRQKKKKKATDSILWNNFHQKAVRSCGKKNCSIFSGDSKSDDGIEVDYFYTHQ